MSSFIFVHIAVVALVLTLQCGLEAKATIGRTNLDNSLPRNVVRGSPKRSVKNFVKLELSSPDTVRHIPGTRLELLCSAVGKPMPKLEWLKNGEPMTEFGNDDDDIESHITSVGTIKSKLIMESVDDGDVFTCVGTSRIKQKTASTTVFSTSDDDELLTIQKLLFKPSKPVINYYIYEILQHSGTDMVLPCRVYSNTKTEIFWTDPNEEIIYGNSGRMRVLPSGDLFIRDLLWEDMGNYTCIAKNMYGKDSVLSFVYPLKLTR